MSHGIDPLIGGIADVQKGAEIATFAGHSDLVTSDTNRLASGSFDWIVRVWEMPTCAADPTFKGYSSNPVRSVAISLNGDVLASGSCDWTVRLWNMQEGGKVATFMGHKAWVGSFDFSSNEAASLLAPVTGPFQFGILKVATFINQLS